MIFLSAHLKHASELAIHFFNYDKEIMKDTQVWERELEASMVRITKIDKANFLPGFDFFGTQPQPVGHLSWLSVEKQSVCKNHRFLRNLSRTILHEKNENGDFSVLLASRNEEVDQTTRSASSRRELFRSECTATVAEPYSRHAIPDQPDSKNRALRKVKIDARSIQKHPPPHQETSAAQFRKVTVDVEAISRACEERLHNFHHPLRPLSSL